MRIIYFFRNDLREKGSCRWVNILYEQTNALAHSAEFGLVQIHINIICLCYGYVSDIASFHCSLNNA